MRSPLRTAARARARPRLGQGKQRGEAAPLLHGSAAGPPRPPHSPRPRPRAAAAVTAVVPAAATAAAPTAAATPDDNRAAILGALRQRRTAAPACGTAAHSPQRLRSEIAPSQCARRKRASGMRGPRGARWPLRQERRGGVGGARAERSAGEKDAGAGLSCSAEKRPGWRHCYPSLQLCGGKRESAAVDDSRSGRPGLDPFGPSGRDEGKVWGNNWDAIKRERSP